jgi:hypothetical protein
MSDIFVWKSMYSEPDEGLAGVKYAAAGADNHLFFVTQIIQFLSVNMYFFLDQSFCCSSSVCLSHSICLCVSINLPAYQSLCFSQCLPVRNKSVCLSQLIWLPVLIRLSVWLLSLPVRLSVCNDLSLLILLLFHIRPSLLISDNPSISARGLYQSICLSVDLRPIVCACLDSNLFTYLLPYEFCKSAFMCLFNKNSVWLYRCLCSYLSIRLYQYVRLSIFLSVALLRNIGFVIPPAGVGSKKQCAKKLQQLSR